MSNNLSETSVNNLTNSDTGASSNNVQNYAESDNSSPTPSSVSIKRKKRRRTRSHNSSPSPGRGFYIPGFTDDGTTGFKKMTMTELMDATNGITNMFLAHEIAVDKQFKLQDLTTEESNEDRDKNSCTTHVRKMVHDIFWNKLKEELSADPPIFDHTFSLLDNIRSAILCIISPRQTRLKTEICDRFDLEIIRQQADKGVLNVTDYIEYIIGLLGSQCAPIRDEEIEGLRKISSNIQSSNVDGMIDLFRSIMITLDHMRVDMANFTIQQARPIIVSQAVEYEKMKFKEFLASQKDGLLSTREWLLRHRDDEGSAERRSTSSVIDDIKFHRLQINRVLNSAYVELLEWDEYYLLPETLVMDQRRVLSLRNLVERVAVCIATILLTFCNVSSYIIPSDAQKVKEKLKEHIDIILKQAMNDDDFKQLLPNVAEQIINDVDNYLQSKEKGELSESVVNTLKSQIIEIEDPNHRIRDLVQRRILEFCKQAISATSRSGPLQVPPGLSLCQRDLTYIAETFVRLVGYNRIVFEEIYTDIIENHVLFVAKTTSN